RAWVNHFSGFSGPISLISPAMVGETVAMAPGTDPGQFLRDLWYMPALAKSLARGQMLREICPHRGVPLSAGRILANETVECPYHGWRFRKSGSCAKIPSLTGHES